MEQEQNVKCSTCGKSTFCSQCKTEQGDFEHICFECLQKQGGKAKENTHACIPQEQLEQAYDKFMVDVINGAFVELWTAEKKSLKELSKQELAKASFFKGANFMLSFMRKMSKEGGQK